MRKNSEIRGSSPRVLAAHTCEPAQLLKNPFAIK